MRRWLRTIGFVLVLWGVAWTVLCHPMMWGVMRPSRPTAFPEEQRKNWERRQKGVDKTIALGAICLGLDLLIALGQRIRTANSPAAVNAPLGDGPSAAPPPRPAAQTGHQQETEASFH